MNGDERDRLWSEANKAVDDLLREIRDTRPALSLSEANKLIEECLRKNEDLRATLALYADPELYGPTDYGSPQKAQECLARTQ